MPNSGIAPAGTRAEDKKQQELAGSQQAKVRMLKGFQTMKFF
jgi:hypothetical protein